LAKDMKATFLRHGHALDFFTAKVTNDSLRPLSDEGKKQVEMSIDLLKKLGFSPFKIISSPYKRAIETATIAAKNFGLDRIFQYPELAGQDADSALSVSLNFSQGKDILIVGHQPLLKIMAEKVTGENAIEMPTGGFALIDIEDVKNLKGKLLYNKKDS